MSALPLLVELGTEELPPGSVGELAQAFCDGMTAGLSKRGIAFGAARALWTPRRLVVSIADLAVTQPEQMLERRGPALNAGLDAAGQPTRALAGFAASCGVDVAALAKLETDKGSWFVHRSVRPGMPTLALLPEIVGAALAALPIPRPMRWGEREVQFVRPVHWLLILLGDEVVPGEVLGLKSDRLSRGHRFHHPSPVPIAAAQHHAAALLEAKVVVDPDERRARISAQVQAQAEGLGLAARIEPALLEEVCNLTEWPVAIACSFDEDFLAVPHEALVTTMEKNQRFFPLFDGERLTGRFVGVANIDSSDPAEIRKGYERVIRPRFADAKFFWDEDLKTPLAQHQQALEKVTYQQKLGSVWDKCCRVAELARVIASRVGVDAALATRAAALSRCDLMTRMVGEFPELQGTMGRYYATAQGEHPEVAAALEQFYAPRQAGGAIADGALGRVLAVAEKLDTLAGLFAIGQKPSGNKDPFSLRRNALGLARTLIEGGMDLDLTGLLREAAAPIAAERAEPVAAELYEFILERLRGYYADQGIAGDAFEAVLAVRPESLVDFDQRVRAVAAFAALPEAASLAAANKRIGNILRQAREKGEAFDTRAAAGAAPVAEEAALAQAIAVLRAEVDAAVAGRDYVTALMRLASLRPAVDAFFDQVMVMAEDADVRRNRLHLLADLRARFVAIADISLLQSA